MSHDPANLLDAFSLLIARFGLAFASFKIPTECKMESFHLAFEAWVITALQRQFEVAIAGQDSHRLETDVFSRHTDILHLINLGQGLDSNDLSP